MWSLQNILELNSSYFPNGFSAKNGIKSLFPAGYTGSINLLSTYVYVRTGTVNIDTFDFATYFIAADGQGRWYFSWTGNPNSDATTGSISDANIRLQAGFVFLHSDTEVGHGYVDTSRPDNFSLSCNSGVDPWIAKNWPKIFLSDVHIGYQQASGFVSLPSESNIWTGAGFAESNFQQLNGIHEACAGNGSGSTIFQEELNIFMVLQVRDASLASSLVNLTADEFVQLWNNAQTSKTTLQSMINHFNVRYASADSRTLLVSGSARSFAAVPFQLLSLSSSSQSPTEEGGSETAFAGVGFIFAGAMFIASAPLSPAVTAFGGASIGLGAGVTGFGILEMINARATPTSITANSSPTQSPTSAPGTTTTRINSQVSTNIYLTPTAPSIPVQSSPTQAPPSSAPFFKQTTPATLIPPSASNPSGTIVVGGTCVDPAAGIQSQITFEIEGTTLTFNNVDQLCTARTILEPIDDPDPGDPSST